MFLVPVILGIYKYRVRQASFLLLSDRSVQKRKLACRTLQTSEPLVPGPSHFEVEIAISELKKYKSPGSDQIPAELIQEGGETLLSQIYKVICSIWNKVELTAF
jgi:hypothetical protein